MSSPAPPVSAKRPWTAADRLETAWLALAPVAGRITLAVLFAVLGMWLFGFLAHEVYDSGTKRFDSAVIAFFDTHQWAPLHAVMRMVSTIAGPNVQTCLAIIGVLGFLIARRFWPDGMTLLIAGAGGALLMIGLKWLFHRPRPTEIFTERLGYSFPSGHSFFALVLYGLAAYWLTREAPPHRRRLLWNIAVFAILLVGFSRIYLGEHYPSDVAAGFAIGLPWLWGCLALPTAFYRRANRPPLTMDERRVLFERGRQQLQATAPALPALAGLMRGLSADPRLSVLRRIGLRLSSDYVSLCHGRRPSTHAAAIPYDSLLVADVALRGVVKKAPPAVLSEHWRGGEDLLPLLHRIQIGLDALLVRVPADESAAATAPVRHAPSV